LPVLALPVLVAALAGCGGGGGDETSDTTTAPTTAPAALSKAELISQGDASCAEVNAAVGTIGSTSSGADGQAAQVAGLYSGMVERLKGLGPPAEREAGYSEFIAAAEELAQAEGEVKLAAGEEGETLAGAEAEASTALSSFQSAASSYGFEDCAEAPAAPTPSAAGGGAEEAGEEAAEAVEEGEVEAAPEEEAEPAPEAGGVEEGAGGGAGVGGGTEGGGGGGTAGGESGGIGPG
jgi:hypothetical protein